MSNRSTGFLIALLAGLHLVFGIFYAHLTPYRAPGLYLDNSTPQKPAFIPDIGAPDERQHANNVQSFMDGKLPVLDPTDPQLGEHYQAHQPPLYYALSAGVAKAAGAADVEQESTGWILRDLNVVIGCLNIWGVFMLGLWGFGRRDVAACGAAFAALLPMNLALSGAISNDPLLFCLCTWCLAVAVLCFRDGWNRKRALALGVLLGLALLTKTTALALIPPLLIGLFVFKERRPTGKQLLAFIGIAAVLALPWWIRNQQLYGDPFAMKAFNQAFTGSPTKTSLGWDWPTYLERVWYMTSRSFVGAFGYMDIRLPDMYYRVSWALALILLFGAFLLLRKPEWREAKAYWVLAGWFIAVVLILFAGFNYRYFQGQARYIFPAIAPISILFGMGIIYFAKDRWQTSLVAWIVVLGSFNAFILAQFLPSQFKLRTDVYANYMGRGQRQLPVNGP